MSVTQLGDATLSLSTYLVRRANTYYFRARIPADIAVATGRSQIVVSLRTTELRIAKVAAARVCVSLSTICGTIRSMADDVFTDRIDGLTKAQRLASAAFAMGQDYEIQRAKLRAHFDEQLRLLAASIPDDDCKLTVPAMPLGEIGDATLLELVNRHAKGTPYRRAKRTPLMRQFWLVQVANRRAPRARVARFTGAGGAGAWEVPVCPPGQVGPGPWNATSLVPRSDAVFEAPAFVSGFDDVAMMRQPVE